MTATSMTGGEAGAGASRAIAAEVPAAGIDKRRAATAVRTVRLGERPVMGWYCCGRHQCLAWRSAWTLVVRAL
jgi:hypothetical protein